MISNRSQVFFLGFLSIFVLSVFVRPAQASSDERRFNFFIYVNATEKKIEDDQILQIKNLEKTRKKSNANYFVQIKNSRGTTKRFLINEHGRTHEEKIDIPDFSAWKQISNFVSWGNSISRGKRNILILSSHGGFYGTTDSSIFNDDMRSNSSTSIHEYVLALEYVRRELGQPLDILLFDACYASSIEVHAQTYGYAHYFIGSPDEISEVGVDYAEISRRVAADASTNLLTISNLAELIQNFRITKQQGQLMGGKAQTMDPRAWPMSVYKVDLLQPFISSLREYIFELLNANDGIQDRVKAFVNENGSRCLNPIATRLIDGQSAETPVAERKIVSRALLLGPLLQCLNPQPFQGSLHLVTTYKKMLTEFKKYNSFRNKKKAIAHLESKNKIINDGVSVIFHQNTFNDQSLISQYQRLRFDYFSNWSLLGSFLTAP